MRKFRFNVATWPVPGWKLSRDRVHSWALLLQCLKRGHADLSVEPAGCSPDCRPRTSTLPLIQYPILSENLLKKDYLFQVHQFNLVYLIYFSQSTNVYWVPTKFGTYRHGCLQDTFLLVRLLYKVCNRCFSLGYLFDHAVLSWSTCITCPPTPNPHLLSFAEKIEGPKILIFYSTQRIDLEWIWVNLPTDQCESLSVVIPFGSRNVCSLDEVTALTLSRPQGF